jgi:hypothetical protein
VTVGTGEVPATAIAAGADRAIERRWLEGEAAARRLPAVRGLAVLRGRVADAIAGRGRLPDARALARRFEDYHARWRAVTRCVPELRDPHADRCGNAAPAPAGLCRWLGEDTVCELARHRGWRVDRAAAAGRPRTFRARIAALRAARADYVAARRARARRAERRHAGAAPAPDRPDHAGLSPAATEAARAACGRQVDRSTPYVFAFGLQDVAGQVEGLVSVRDALGRELRAGAPGAGDRRALAPLLTAIAAGSRELERLATADLAGDRADVARRVARFDDRTAAEREVSRRLGLGDCLVRPAR